MNNLGFMHSRGLLGEADQDLAMELWLAAADRGHARAQGNLGRELLRRATSRLHYCEAVAYLKLAAAQGYGEYDLAQCYANGRGVSVDLREARKWYARAAAHGEEGAAAEVARIDAYYGDDPRSDAESSDGSDDDVRAILRVAIEREVAGRRSVTFRDFRGFGAFSAEVFRISGQIRTWIRTGRVPVHESRG